MKKEKKEDRTLEKTAGETNLQYLFSTTYPGLLKQIISGEVDAKKVAQKALDIYIAKHGPLDWE